MERIGGFNHVRPVPPSEKTPEQLPKKLPKNSDELEAGENGSEEPEELYPHSPEEPGKGTLFDGLA